MPSAPSTTTPSLPRTETTTHRDEISHLGSRIRGWNPVGERGLLEDGLMTNSKGWFGARSTVC